MEYDVVVVHYKNDEVYGVIEGVIQQSISPRRIVLVDNSRTVDADRLDAISPDVLLVAQENEGYAAAANLGIRALGDDIAPYVVMLTHEVRLEKSTLATLITALEEDASIAAAGPVLRYRSAPDRIFSSGGRLDRFGRPSHITSVPPALSRAIVRVAWIDGSVMALRRSAIEGIGLFDPRYFLYFEEIDLAVRLTAAGWGTAVVRGATAWQEPGDYPPYLAVRNRLLMLRRNPELLTAPRLLLHPRLLLEIGWALRRRGANSLRPSLRGLVDGRRGISGHPRH